MKKLISGLALLLVASCSSMGDLKENTEITKQRMPIPDERFYLRSQTWYYDGKAGVGDLYDTDGDGKWDKIVNYIKCNGEKSGYPFGIYYKSTRTLYLDNDLKKSINSNVSDGFVDWEIENPVQRPVDKDAPDCP